MATGMRHERAMLDQWDSTGTNKIKFIFIPHPHETECETVGHVIPHRAADTLALHVQSPLKGFFKYRPINGLMRRTVGH